MPDRNLRDYSQSVSKAFNTAEIENRGRTKFILQSSVTLFEHCFQVAGANSAMESVSNSGVVAGTRTVEAFAPARFGSYPRYLTVTTRLKVRTGEELLRQGAVAHRWR
jgi:hypothetical protein